ncbi:TonB-dependent receptor [Acetobacteraceae bacterium]|nr:TonB-dependent receptor [Acetobacteraceae bacterium]
MQFCHIERDMDKQEACLLEFRVNMLSVLRFRRKNRLLLSAVMFCGMVSVSREVQAQDISTSIETPSTDPLSAQPMTSFSGAATGETETSAPAPDSMNAVTPQTNPETEGQEMQRENDAVHTVSGEGNDLTQGTSYKHYFGPGALALPATTPVLDVDDPRNGPTYKKFFASEDRSPRRKKRVRAGGPRMKPEHFGVAGHRRHRQPNVEESTNAETVIGRDTLGHFIEGTNALQALALSTPGANFTSTDAQGTDAVENTFYMRGYDEDQLGVTMDGIPMGDQGFGGADGVDVSQILIQENIGSLAASQGAGGLDTPSDTTLGGTLTYTTLDPSDKFDVKISQQFGSFAGYRTFGRLDSGVLNHTGTKFTASFLRNADNLWTNGYDQPWGTQGRGFQRQEAMNFKLVQPISNFGKISLTSDWSDSPEYNYATLNPGMKKHFGYGISNMYPNYQAGNQWGQACNSKSTAGLGLPANSPITTSDLCGLNYGEYQVERNYLEAIKGDFQISPSIKSSSVVYGQVTDNWLGGTNTGWKSPASFGPLPYGSGMNDGEQHLKGRRLGVTQNFQFQLGHRNTLKTGVWYENTRYHEPYLLYGEYGPSGLPNDFNLTNSEGFQAYDQTLTSNTFQFYVQDDLQLAKNMKFSYGFKSLVESTNGGFTEGDRASNAELANWGVPANTWRPAYGRITSSNAFLPHFNYDWKFLPKHEFYFDVAENMAPIDDEAWSTGLGNPKDLGSGQVAFGDEKQKLRGERTWNYVVGYRYSGKPFGFSIDYYHTDYIGRLGLITDNGVGTSAETVSEHLANLGNEKMDGMDLMGVAHLSHMLGLPDYLGQLDFMNSFSYNHAVYETNNPTLSSINGQQQVYYPRYMYKTNINYTNGRVGFDLNVNYNSKTNITYSGDVKNPAYWTSELTAFVLLGKRGKENNAKLTFGVSNLFNQHYTVTAYGKTPLNSGGNTDTMSQNLVWSAPQEFFGSLSVGF